MKPDCRDVEGVFFRERWVRLMAEERCSPKQLERVTVRSGDLSCHTGLRVPSLVPADWAYIQLLVIPRFLYLRGFDRFFMG